MKYVCHSGGALGSDITWENECDKYGIMTLAYSFDNHVQKGKNQHVLTVDELNEGFEHVKIASKSIKQNPNHPSPYVRNLLSRNWFQVKNSAAIFAIGMFRDKRRVKGGTGWAVQMAIDNNKPTYFFDQINNQWNSFCYQTNQFRLLYTTPKLTENFAGIGTREINSNGVTAIQKILEFNLGPCG